MAHVSGFDRRRRAQTMGYMSAGEDAGEMAGPLLAGAIWGAFGAPVLLLARIVMAVGAEAYTHAATKDLDEATAPERGTPGFRPRIRARSDERDSRLGTPV